MYDGIEFRGHHQKDVEALAKNAGPVWNGSLMNTTQMIADFFTLKEHWGTLQGKTLTYVGDARNIVAHDLLITGAILGVNIHVAAPKALQPDEDIQVMAQKYAAESSSDILITDDIQQAIYQTDAIYTDVWFSMGEDQSVLEPLSINYYLIK